MVIIADFLLKSVAIAKRIQDSHGKKLIDFTQGVEADEEVSSLREQVHAWASQFGMPGI